VLLLLLLLLLHLEMLRSLLHEAALLCCLR
jgi:hypothetical protein